MLKRIGVRADIGKIERINRKQGREEVIVVEIGTWEQKRNIMERKKMLVDSRIRIEGDLTWRERENNVGYKESSGGREERGKKDKSNVWKDVNRGNRVGEFTYLEAKRNLVIDYVTGERYFQISVRYPVAIIIYY